jgi:hypothetical protein
LDGLKLAEAAVPGTIARAPIKTIAAGASTETRRRVEVVTVSFSVYGNEMLGSVKEKGCWFGVCL